MENDTARAACLCRRKTSRPVRLVEAVKIGIGKLAQCRLDLRVELGIGIGSELGFVFRRRKRCLDIGSR